MLNHLDCIQIQHVPRVSAWHGPKDNQAPKERTLQPGKTEICLLPGFKGGPKQLHSWHRLKTQPRACDKRLIE